tara:strand:- start:249 stop:902 length:654 start_codon:yes stop_codon:yes gene_type:complete
VTAQQQFDAPIGAGDRLIALKQSDGHASAAHYQALLANAQPPELADLVHFLCLLHGRRPGVIDHAASTATGDERAWLDDAADAFMKERLYITRLTVDAGPVTGVSEDDHSEAAAVELRGSFQLLSRSERRGCAIGAALAFALDWPDLRAILDPLARRLGIDPPLCALPREREVRDLAESLSATPAVSRAMMFGADQLFQLQRGAWRLLAARARLRAQ